MVCYFSAGDLELDCNPFPHCIIRNFLGSETFVENLQRELLQLNFHEKSNDLYKFKQVEYQTDPDTDRSQSLLCCCCCLNYVSFTSLLFTSSQTT